MSHKKFKPVDPNPDFAKLEDELLRFWEGDKIFEKSLAQTKDNEPYVFYEGPPFATGLPHYGHILASTIKDLIPRYQTMKGHFVRRRWGWDCHGLPIEEIVERELGISGKKDIEKYGIDKFNEKCRATVLMYTNEWGKMVRRLARWTEFENAYKTMDRDYIESVWWGFKEIHKKGLVYEGRKVLLYCPRCETPISNFEVAMDNSYQEVTEEAVTVKFKVKGQENTYLLAWTTTPWTLPGNLALAVGEDIMYEKVKAKNKNEFYIIARATKKLALPEEYETVEKIKGTELVGLDYEPLFDISEMESDKSYKVYPGDFVNTEEGTGIVHTAVVYGEDDYNLGIKEGLPVVPLLDEKGHFNELAPKFIQGMFFKDAENPIKDDLEKRNLLFERKNNTHSYPHCWRCSSQLYYNAIPSWFIKISEIRDKLLETNEREMNWYPAHLKHGRYQKSVEAAPDWNISRNRYWGNPIPVWKCEACDGLVVIGSRAELKEKAISGYSDDLDLHRPYIDEVVVECDQCAGAARRITEIFDSWVEAGSMPFAEYHYPFENKEKFESSFPAQFVVEYIAQTRAWFYVMHVVSLILFDRAPFENILTTGTIMAEDWSKLSKSKRNFPDPWKVIEEYGVDTLRFYLMNSVVMQGDNMNFSEKEIAIIHRKVIRILWNVYNYFVTYANEHDWQFDAKVSARQNQNSPNILDQWQNTRLAETINSVTEHLDNYDTVKATRVLADFVSDLSLWYLRRSRGRQDPDFFATMFHTLIHLSKLLAPITPYLAEKIYLNLNNGNSDFPPSVHLTAWPDKIELTKQQQELLEQMSELRKIVEQGHSLRADAGVKLRQPLEKLYLSKQESGIINQAGLLEILKDELNVKEVAPGDKFQLDTKITPELEIEGLTRELERAVNNFRKESGLAIGEQASLSYQTKSDKIEKALQNVDLAKVYLSEVKNQQSEVNSEKTVKLNDLEVWFGLEIKK